MKNLLFIFGQVFLCLPLINLILWFRISSSQKSFEQSVSEYLQIYPTCIANAFIITTINILSSIIASAFFILSKNKSSNNFFLPHVLV
ncbi:MAG: hypothetical protein C4308_03820 [Chitinophagaceae bacterium]